jgi:hypothetical protein
MDPDGLRLVREADPGPFSAAELDGVPDPVPHHLSRAIAAGTPLARSAYVRMRGRIKVGVWLPFRAREVLSPHDGFVWAARAAGLINGSDRYVDGAGRSEWALLRRTLVRADGPDITRSAAGRAGAEAIWLPTALLPRYGVRWTAPEPGSAISSFTVDGVDVVTHYRLDGDGRIRSFVFDRWGDPDNTGTWGWHPFGGEITAHGTFDGVTIPAAGRLGWYSATAGASFRFRITELRLLSHAGRAD